MPEARYLRQSLVEGIGDEGQRRIRAARAAVVGVGALGCAVSDQLSRGGLGFLRLIDPDIPEISNIQRQVLIDEADVRDGTPKAMAAAAKIRRANSEVRVEPLVTRLDGRNARSLIDDVDLVLDGTDNFETRYLMNEACVAAGVPYVFGGVLASSGMTFPVLPGGPCLRCAFGPMPAPGIAPTTAQAGVLCSIVATIASLEVVRAIKIICGAPVDRRLVVVDLWGETMRSLEVSRLDDCPVCGPR